MVEAILVGSPAAADGRIMPGDLIISVDGSGSGHYHVSTESMSLDEISSLVLGRRDSSVEFCLMRPSTSGAAEGGGAQAVESQGLTFTVRLRRGEADPIDLELNRLREANEALTQALLAVSEELEAREKRLAESVSVNAHLAARLSMLSDELQAHRLALGEKDSLVQCHSQSLQAAERAIEALESQRDELKRELHQSAREKQQCDDSGVDALQLAEAQVTNCQRRIEQLEFSLTTAEKTAAAMSQETDTLEQQRERVGAPAGEGLACSL